MQLNGPALAMVALLLTACAPSAVTANTSLPGDKEPHGMEQPKNPEQRDAPTATQLLEGLLRLIESSGNVKDFTAERLQKELGVRIEVQDRDGWGASGAIDDTWWYGMSMQHATTQDAVFTFTFAPGQRDTTPAMTAICAIDMAMLGERLARQGMQHSTHRAEHGLPLSERYSRSGLRVEVFGRQEADEPEDVRRHQCVQRVVIK